VAQKNAQSLMHRHFTAVCSRIKRFSLKCLEKITVYHTMQNLYQLIKYSMINRRNWIHVMSDVNPACEHYTSDSWRSVVKLHWHWQPNSRQPMENFWVVVYVDKHKCVNVCVYYCCL